MDVNNHRDTLNTQNAVVVCVHRYTVQSLRADIKSLRDSVKLVAEQLDNCTLDKFRHRMKSFIEVCTVTSL